MRIKEKHSAELAVKWFCSSGERIFALYCFCAFQKHLWMLTACINYYIYIYIYFYINHYYTSLTHKMQNKRRARVVPQ